MLSRCMAACVKVTIVQSNKSSTPSTNTFNQECETLNTETAATKMTDMSSIMNNSGTSSEDLLFRCQTLVIKC